MKKYINISIIITSLMFCFISSHATSNKSNNQDKSKPKQAALADMGSSFCKSHPKACVLNHERCSKIRCKYTVEEYCKKYPGGACKE